MARLSDFSGAIESNGLYANNGGIIIGSKSNARKGVEDSSDDVRCGRGSIIQFVDGTGGTNITPNEVTSAGIIFK